MSNDPDTAKAAIEVHNEPLYPIKRRDLMLSIIAEAWRWGAQSGQAEGNEPLSEMPEHCGELIIQNVTGSQMAQLESPDSNVEAIRQKLLTRSQVGLAKYGVTTERQDVDLAGWLKHLQEELLDAAVYVEAALKRVENAGLSKTEGDERNV